MPSDASNEQDPETQRERYGELLDELRTIIPGVQVLLGFLLTVPFSSRFAELDELGTTLYLVTLMAAALAVVVFLVPSAYHRLTPHTERRQRIEIGVRSVLSGLALFGVAITTATLVVVRFIFTAGIGVASAAALVLAILVLWVTLPLLRDRRRS